MHEPAVTKFKANTGPDFDGGVMRPAADTGSLGGTGSTPEAADRGIVLVRETNTGSPGGTGSSPEAADGGLVFVRDTNVFKLLNRAPLARDEAEAALSIRQVENQPDDVPAGGLPTVICQVEHKPYDIPAASLPIVIRQVEYRPDDIPAGGLPIVLWKLAGAAAHRDVHLTLVTHNSIVAFDATAIVPGDSSDDDDDVDDEDESDDESDPRSIPNLITQIRFGLRLEVGGVVTTRDYR